MERLTKRSNKTVHENGVCCTHFRSVECIVRLGNCANSCPWEEAVWSKLADYEDAEEQGLLHKFPCKVGDTVYIIVKKDISPQKVVEIRVSSGNGTEFVTNRRTFHKSNFGKTVFLTHKAAEAALGKGGVRC